jgi:DNA replicative helicase MCM subunit Mcm2 (Cdc46/Mcm family)
VNLDFQVLKEKSPLKFLLETFFETPQLIISSMEVAIHKTIYGSAEPDVHYEKINVRISNFDNTLPLKKLKSNFISKSRK